MIYFAFIHSSVNYGIEIDSELLVELRLYATCTKIWWSSAVWFL